MASYFTPQVLLFKAGGTIALGHAVKFGTDGQTVVECTATTDKSIGIAAGDAASGEKVEVHVPGGGSKAKLNATVTRGQLLTSDTNGMLKKVAAANDRIVAMAMDSGVQNDIIPVHVVAGQATATES